MLFIPDISNASKSKSKYRLRITILVFLIFCQQLPFPNFNVLRVLGNLVARMLRLLLEIAFLMQYCERNKIPSLLGLLRP